MNYTTNIWAQLFLSKTDSDRIRDFLVNDIGIKSKFIVKHMHMTVYHGRRPMPGVIESHENIHFILPALETRFMVMAPGGENARPNLIPGKRKVGIRIHRQSPAMKVLKVYRDRLINLETKAVLGKRQKSNMRRNAFGSRYFQPHLAIIEAGSGIAQDLTWIGKLFRETLGNLIFDKFIVEVKLKPRDDY